ncbi:outer membrane beta-barrel protein [Croceimicrobium sp.]|uniref:outer membrane beta-barrel protein n=1 Tax=Croceimicrobium sp. TaxID=2828340 RepID=UPI003BA938A6
MKNCIRLGILCLALGLSLNSNAQTKRTKYYEFGGGLGTMNMSNEIANSSNVNAILAEMAPSISIFAKYHVNDWFGIGFDVNYANLKAADQNHNNFNRGLSVRTSLLNSNAFTEIHFIRFGKYHLEDKWTVFIKGGVGVTGWNPELSFNKLIPEDIDVETNAYSGFSYFYGLGAKYRLAYQSILTFELRFSNSGGDTMDGFLETKEGVISTNDTYWGMLFSYSYAIF